MGDGVFSGFFVAFPHVHTFPLSRALKLLGDGLSYLQHIIFNFLIIIKFKEFLSLIGVKASKIISALPKHSIFDNFAPTSNSHF